MVLGVHGNPTPLGRKNQARTGKLLLEWFFISLLEPFFGEKLAPKKNLPTWLFQVFFEGWFFFGAPFPKTKNPSNKIGGFNAFEKYARENGSFPEIRVKITNI